MGGREGERGGGKERGRIVGQTISIRVREGGREGMCVRSDLISEGGYFKEDREVWNEASCQHKHDSGGSQETVEQWPVLSQTGHEWMALENMERDSE